MSSLKAVFLDFDGVILESVDVKGWAFGELFKEYPQWREQIIKYHHAHGGVPRYDKIRYIYREFLKRPLTEDSFNKLCQQYSRLVFDRVIASKFVLGAFEFLNEYYKELRLFIISGTPQDEIRRIVIERELDIYFEGVLGSPESKDFWTEYLLKKHHLKANEVLWVGDAISDYEAAIRDHIPFIGRVRESRDIFEEKDGVYKIRNLFELSDYLKQNYSKVKGV